MGKSRMLKKPKFYISIVIEIIVRLILNMISTHFSILYTHIRLATFRSIHQLLVLANPDTICVIRNML